MPSGSLYYGPNGFAYKKMGGGGVSRIPGVKYNAMCFQPYTLDNRYVNGSGVGANSVAVRRAKRFRSSNCFGFCNQALNASLPELRNPKNPITIPPGGAVPNVPRRNPKGTYNQVVYHSSDGLAFI